MKRRFYCHDLVYRNADDLVLFYHEDAPAVEMVNTFARGMTYSDPIDIPSDDEDLDGLPSLDPLNLLTRFSTPASPVARKERPLFSPIIRRSNKN